MKDRLASTGGQRPDQIGEGRESIAKQICQLLLREQKSHESQVAKENLFSFKIKGGAKVGYLGPH